MKIIQKDYVSLGLESFYSLGFDSEEELNKEISKLMKVRTEIDTKSKIKLS